MDNSGKVVPAGVYFYICILHVMTLNGQSSKDIHGTVTIFR